MCCLNPRESPTSACFVCFPPFKATHSPCFCLPLCLVPWTGSILTELTRLSLFQGWPKEFSQLLRVPSSLLQGLHTDDEPVSHCTLQETSQLSLAHTGVSASYLPESLLKTMVVLSSPIIVMTNDLSQLLPLTYYHLPTASLGPFSLEFLSYLVPYRP